MPLSSPILDIFRKAITRDIKSQIKTKYVASVIFEAMHNKISVYQKCEHVWQITGVAL